MKLPAAAYSAEVATSATKAGSNRAFGTTYGSATLDHIIPDHYLCLNRGGIFCRGGGGGDGGRGWL